MSLKKKYPKDGKIGVNLDETSPKHEDTLSVRYSSFTICFNIPFMVLPSYLSVINFNKKLR